MKLEFALYILKRSSHVKFHGNLSSGSQVVPCRWTDMTKLTVTFAIFQMCLKIRTVFVYVFYASKYGL